MSRTRACVLALCLLAPVACERRPAPPAPTAASSTAALDDLLHRMHQRLDLMHMVARVKWNAQAPVHDPQREEVLLRDVVERGRAHHLDAEVTRAFFSAQMEAAKLVQEEDFRRWRAAQQAPFPPVPELAILRQRIDALNGELLEALAHTRPFLDTADGQRRLEDRVPIVFADYPVSVRDAALRGIWAGKKP